MTGLGTRLHRQVRIESGQMKPDRAGIRRRGGRLPAVRGHELHDAFLAAQARILSSAEKCRRVARWMSFTTFSADSFTGPDLCSLQGYDEPGIFPSSTIATRSESSSPAWNAVSTSSCA